MADSFVTHELTDSSYLSMLFGPIELNDNKW
jgi:hypothetical protein